MKRTASQVYQSLVAKLAATGRMDKLAAVKKYGENMRIAISKDTEQFCEWALNTQQPLDSGDVQNFISNVVGVKPRPPAEAGAKGPRWQTGKLVNIRADKHKYGGKDVYEKFDKKIGTITEIDGSDVLVAFKGEPAPVRFPDANKPMGVGMYAYTEPFSIPGAHHVEIVYISGTPSSSDAQVVVDHYMSKSRPGEKRNMQYYTGYVSDASIGQKGYYFRLYSQQRVDPNIEDGGSRPRTFNPSLGEVYYIGVVGKRPKGWKDEIEKIEEAAEGSDKKASAGKGKKSALDMKALIVAWDDASKKLTVANSELEKMRKALRRASEAGENVSDILKDIEDKKKAVKKLEAEEEKAYKALSSAQNQDTNKKAMHINQHDRLKAQKMYDKGYRFAIVDWAPGREAFYVKTKLLGLEMASQYPFTGGRVVPLNEDGSVGERPAFWGE